MKTKTIIIKQISTSAYFKISLPGMLATPSYSNLNECRKSKALMSSFMDTFTENPALFAQYNEVKTGLRLPDYVKLHYPELFL
jgi:hypothetical protein